MAKNLVIAPVGDRSLHQYWVGARGKRKFDVFLIYYGDQGDRYIDECEYYLKAKGLKWPLLHKARRQFAQEIDNYDAVWCPDDDIETTPETVERMFDLFHIFGLALGQPAFTEGSHVWFQITRQCPFARLRLVDLVELGVPIFSRAAFRALGCTFGESKTGWGLDLLWGKMLAYQKMGVIHEIGVLHTRPYFSGSLYAGQEPMTDFRDVVRKYQLWDALGRGDGVFHTVLAESAPQYVRRLFESELPAAFERNPAAVRTIGSSYEISIDTLGKWFIDVSTRGPVCRVGEGTAECTVLFKSPSAFYRYLEAPRRRLADLFLTDQVAIGGRQTDARKLARVFELLFPYHYVEGEDLQ